MKKLVFAFCMMFGAVVAVNAQDTTSTKPSTDPSVSSQASTSQEDGRVKIKSQDLPETVKSSLESQEFRGWLVNSAYKVDAASSTEMSGSTSSQSSTGSDSTSVSSSSSATGSHNKEIYIVELKNGAQTKTVRFDKDGKKLEDEGMNDDQK